MNNDNNKFTKRVQLYVNNNKIKKINNVKLEEELSKFELNTIVNACIEEIKEKIKLEESDKYNNYLIEIINKVVNMTNFSDLNQLSENEKDKIKEVISLLELSVCIPPIYENNIYYNEIDGDVLSYMDNSIEKLYKDNAIEKIYKK